MNQENREKQGSVNSSDVEPNVERSRVNNKKCPKCGEGFRCDGDRDCWCESVQIHKKEMIQIMELYTDCLCPACLKEYERE